ncbi:hypothetical protein PENTCL1PPCAC_10288, partial [Pristionchus entomophagus]
KIVKIAIKARKEQLKKDEESRAIKKKDKEIREKFEAEKRIREEKQKKKEKQQLEEKEKKRRNEHKRKGIDGEKKKKRISSDSDSSEDIKVIIRKISSSRQMHADEAMARSLSMMSGSSMYDRVKGRRSGSNNQDNSREIVMAILGRKKLKKDKKRFRLSSSSESDGERKVSEKKWK